MPGNNYGYVAIAHGAQQTQPAPKRGAQSPRCHSGSVSHSHPRTGQVCSSELDCLELKNEPSDSTKKKLKKSSWRVWAGFLSLTQGLVFLTFFYFGWSDNESCAAVTYVTRGAQIRFFFCRTNTGTSRTGTANSCQCFSLGSVRRRRGYSSRRGGSKRAPRAVRLFRLFRVRELAGKKHFEYFELVQA